MPRSRSLLILPAMLIALLAGGLLSTGAWLYQSRGNEPEPAVELIGSPVSPVLPSPVATPGETNTPEPLVSGVAAGQKVYQQYCNACHPGGGQGVGPTLRGAEFQAKYADDALLKKVTVEGIGTMPGFGQLSAAELDDMVAYIRSLE